MTDAPTTIGLVADLVGALAILAGSLLTLVATVGVLRLPDVMSRMHAATKPQTLALLLVVLGSATQLRTSIDVWMLLLVAAFQLITSPVNAHVVGGLAHRTGGVRDDLLFVDDLARRRERDAG